MLQSFAVNAVHPQTQPQLQCNKCKQKPSQFILLLCDHILCGGCLNLANSIKGQYGFDGIRCPCGVVTYFPIAKNNIPGNPNISNSNCSADQDSQREQQCYDSLHTIQKQNNKHFLRDLGQRNKTLNSGSHRESTLIHSKNTMSTKNISRLQTEPYSVENYHEEKQNSYIKRQSVGKQRCSVPIQNSSILRQNNSRLREKNSTDNSLLQYDLDSSIDDKVEEKQNYSPNMTRKTAKRSQIRTQKHQMGNGLTEQLNYELNFLQLHHKKMLDTLERNYIRAVNRINKNYHKLEGTLKDLCLQKCFNSHQSDVDIAGIVKKQYQQCVQNKLESLIQEIRTFSMQQKPTFINIHNKTGELKERIVRYSSPQSYGQSKVQSEEYSIYSPKIKNFTFSQQVDPSMQNSSAVYESTVHNLSKYVQNGHKLHKKSVRNRANVIIQL